MPILYVDDNEPRTFVRDAWLQKAGYRVLRASTGRRALELFDTDHPILALVDVGLPDIGGIELCRRFKQQSPGTPVILFSGHFRTLREQADGLLGGGADRYIIDPIDREHFLAAVHSSL